MDMGAFRGIRRLGGGADGEVWLAAASDGSRVALKVLSLPSDKAVEAARRECALAARIDHPHLLGARSVVCDGDRVAVVLPWAAGGSLADLIAARVTLTVAETLTVLIPVAYVLATAHERGVVHGDLSPANILLTADGRPLVADLGAGRLSLDDDRAVVGTPGCVAPEVARGAVVQPSSDVFALAAIGLWCITGRPAWNAVDLRDVVVQSTVGQWPDPGEATGPPRFLAALRAALSDVPAHRPGAAELRIELSRSGEPEPLPIVVIGDGAVARPRHAHTGSGGRDGVERPVGTVGAGGRGDPGDHGERPVVPRMAATVRHRRQPIDGAPGLPDAVEEVAVPVALHRIRRLFAAGGSPAVGTGSDPVSGSAEEFRSRPRWWRPVIGIAAACLVGGAAVYGGLSWGRSSAAVPMSEQPGTQVAPGAVTPSAMTPSVVTPSAVTPSAVTPRAATTTASLTSAPHSTVPPSAIPTRAVPTHAGPTQLAPSAAGSSSTALPAGSVPAASAPDARSADRGPASWMRVVAGLDATRATAFVTRDPALLSEVYLGGSPALATDRATIRRLADRGWRVGDARHRVRSALPVAPGVDGVVRIRVVDELPSYPVTDATGGTVGRTPARPAATSILELVRTADGYRIRTVEQA